MATALLILQDASLCQRDLTASLQDYPPRPSLADCSLARGSVCARASFGPHKVGPLLQKVRPILVDLKPHWTERCCNKYQGLLNMCQRYLPYRYISVHCIICAPVCTKSSFTTACLYQQLGGTKHHTTEFASELAERSRKASIYWTCQDGKDTCRATRNIFWSFLLPSDMRWLAFHIHPRWWNWNYSALRPFGSSKHWMSELSEMVGLRIRIYGPISLKSVPRVPESFRNLWNRNSGPVLRKPGLVSR